MQKLLSLKRDCFHLAALVGLALAIGVYLIATSDLICEDGVFYIDQAGRLPQDPIGVARTYPPGYPSLLLAGHKVASLFVDGDSALVWIRSAQAVTLLCRIGALIPLCLLGKLLVGARRNFWALLILVVLPYPARYGSDVLREWPFLLFLGLGFWLLVWALRDRKWWLFGLVGLDAGLGYLIRPMCGQLIVYALLGLTVAACTGRREGRGALVGAGSLLVAGFAIPVAPYFVWIGTAVPHHFRFVPVNSAPVITAVAGGFPSYEPLQFAAREGALLEVAIEAHDPDNDALVLSVAAVPPGSRPVYRLRSVEHGTDLWTISEDEKDKLLTHARHRWSYVGIDYYAYAETGVVPGLQPAYRLWSPVLNRHFYTTSKSERRALLEDAEAQWDPDEVEFYVFAEGRQPPGAVPIHRFRDGAGQYFWVVSSSAVPERRSSQGRGAADGIAWYAHAAAEAPPGSAVQGGLFRWCPGSGQRGEHQLNIIVGDGRLQSCQLVRVSVAPADGADAQSQNAQVAETHRQPRLEAAPEPVAVGPPEANEPAPADPVPREQTTNARSVLSAADHVFTGIAENLMVFFLVPFCLGFYHRLRHEAGLQERVLMIAVVAVNVGLMLGRYAWFEPGSARRYSVGLLALTICYVPGGLERMAQGLRMSADRLFGDRGRPEVGERVWFYVLLTIGVAICIPKLLAPMHADKKGYRQVAQWLRDNTESDSVVAVPDGRISLYAERERHIYGQHTDPRRVDYIVTIAADGSAERHPDGWKEVYACWADEDRDKRLAVYLMR
ncbi:MAG: hypothetical protein ACYTAS_08595 [Planctomycetota bacterium]|jgi:hypothetical protein